MPKPSGLIVFAAAVAATVVAVTAWSETDASFPTSVAAAQNAAMRWTEDHANKRPEGYEFDRAVMVRLKDGGHKVLMCGLVKLEGVEGRINLIVFFDQASRNKIVVGDLSDREIGDYCAEVHQFALAHDAFMPTRP